MNIWLHACLPDESLGESEGPSWSLLSAAARAVLEASGAVRAGAGGVPVEARARSLTHSLTHTLTHASQLNSTQLNSTQLNSTQLNSTQLNLIH